MSLKTLLPNPSIRRTSYPAARVRKMISQSRNAIAAMLTKDATVLLPIGRQVPKDVLLTELDAILAEFTALDDLIVAAKKQRQQLAKQLPAIVDLAVLLKLGLPGGAGYTRAAAAQYGVARPKKRRKLTGPEVLIAAAKAHLTRKMRGTKGKRQKRSLKWAGEPITVVVKPKQ